MKREFRLTRSSDFKRVRRNGKSHAHPLVVLVALPSEGGRTLIGVSAGRSLGTAVARNRAKRLLREAVRPLLPSVREGWSIILLARRPILDTTLPMIQAALTQLLRRASLLNDQHAH